MIDLSKLKKETYTKTERIFKLDHVNWMHEFEEDAKNGRLIMVDSPDIITKNMKANDNSLFDSRFNSPINVDNNIIEYSCKCGGLLGRFNEGRTCPECQTKVEVRYSLELLKRGWIDLEDNYIIMPSIYTKLAAYIKTSNLIDILAVDVLIDKDGNEVPLERHPNVNSGKSVNPYVGIGLNGLRKRYIEILEFFKRSTTKPELYQILKDRANLTFTNKILVMSPAHRPAYISKEKKSLNYHDINALFVMILTDINLVKRGKRVGRKADEMIWKIQQYVNQLYKLTIKKLVGKSGLIRSRVISGRVWYSSRMVIISETSTSNIDHVRMSYKGFLSLFELEIINAMLRGYGNPEFAKMTMVQAKQYVDVCKYSTKVDESIYMIMDLLINKRNDDGIYVLINRNPSFDLGSIQCVKVIEVFKDAENMVLSIPLNSLKEMNADFDGDVLNVHSPKERRVIDAFKEGFLPSKLILDRTGGYFNTNMAPIKDVSTYIKSFIDEFKPIRQRPDKLKYTSDILSNINDSDSIVASIYRTIEEQDTIAKRDRTPIKNRHNDILSYNHKFIDPVDDSHIHLEYDPMDYID